MSSFRYVSLKMAQLIHISSHVLIFLTNLLRIKLLLLCSLLTINYLIINFAIFLDLVGKTAFCDKFTAE